MAQMSPASLGEGQLLKHPLNTRAGKRLRDPLDYNHPHDSIRQFAELLALRHDSPRTRHSYYRAMRLVHELSDSKLNATESPKLFATEKKSPDIIVLLLE